MLKIPIDWQGPYTPAQVVGQLDDRGVPPGYDGEDYGLYQIYGKHVLCGPGALLYIGQATEQTFSQRFSQHLANWLADEDPVCVYVGRLYLPKRHTASDNWRTWEDDVKLAEKVLIHKYSPHYNSRSIAEAPYLGGHDKVKLLHSGDRNRLHSQDVAPDDWF